MHRFHLLWCGFREEEGGRFNAIPDEIAQVLADELGLHIGMTTLTETGGGRKIAFLPETLSVLKEKHGVSSINSGNKSSDMEQTAL